LTEGAGTEENRKWKMENRKKYLGGVPRSERGERDRGAWRQADKEAQR
jgi:hypothetical protein